MTTATKAPAKATRKTPSKASKSVPSKKVAGAVKTPATTATANSGVSKGGVPAPTAKGKGAGAFATRKIKLLEMPEAKVKIAPQARIVLEVLEDLGGVATQQEVIDGLLDGGLKTVQTPKRIYTFYRQMMVDKEYIAFVN
jgi:hypothetical protein